MSDRKWWQPQLLHLVILNCTVDENWVCRHRLLQFIFQKWCCVQCSDLCRLFLWMANFLNVSSVCVCVCMCVCMCMKLLIELLFIILSAHFIAHELQSFWLCMCVNFSLFCTHFSCHWHKIRNVSCHMTQISKRWRDPWSNSYKYMYTYMYDVCIWPILKTWTRLRQ